MPTNGGPRITRRAALGVVAGGAAGAALGAAAARLGFGAAGGGDLAEVAAARGLSPEEA